MVRQVATLQDPHAVIVLRAVDENDARASRIEGLSAGVGEQFLARSAEDHLSTLAAALSARARSSVRSLGSSSPIESRMVPCLMPDAASSASGTRKCVVDAGWI